MIKKLKLLDSVNWLHIVACIMCIYSIIMTLLATNEVYQSLFFILLLEVDIYIFTNFTYIKYTNTLMKFRDFGFYTWANNIAFAKYLLDSLSTGCKVMKVCKNISFISFFTWLILYITQNGPHMYDVKIFAGIMCYTFLILKNDEILTHIFSNHETWSNPVITPLKHLKRMMRV